MSESRHPMQPSRFGRLFLILGCIVITIFACSVLLGISLFRKEVRRQVLDRDAILLTNIAQFMAEEPNTANLGAWHYVELALDSSELRDIIAVRVYHPVDTLVQQVPVSLFQASLSNDDKATLKEGIPVVRYEAAFPLDTLFSDYSSIGQLIDAPVVEVLAPILDKSGSCVATIQYWLDGERIAGEFTRIDKYLTSMGAAFILGGILIFTAVFLVARKRLLLMADLLEQRNRSLELANKELANAARTSAIGSVTSHLFHGLKNPLAGLKTYLKVIAGDEEAVAITERMQSLVDEALNVIRDQDQSLAGNVSLEEFAKLLGNRLTTTFPEDKARIDIRATGTATVSSGKAQLLLLILSNLVDNALAADTTGSRVSIMLLADANPATLQIHVKDNGPGLPQHVVNRLFQPVTSSRSEGSGIGLAISSALSRHVPSSLELAHTGPEGTTFILNVPL